MSKLKNWLLAGKRAALDRWIVWKLSQPYPLQRANESLGGYGERIAAIYLKRKGYLLLERSYRQRSGEIDIIAVWERRIVVFVEVKTWSNASQDGDGPSDAVDLDKQTKITKTALSYMKRHRLLENAARADVIEIVLSKEHRHPFIRHFESAFEAVGQYQMHS